MEGIKISLRAYGWNESRAGEFAAYQGEGICPGRVTAVFSHQFEVQTEKGRKHAVLAGKLSHEILYAAARPAVGDFVVLQSNAGGADIIRHILPRRSCLSRQESFGGTEAQVLAANVDVALVVQSIHGDFNPARAQRYLAIVWEAGITPILVLTKADLASPEVVAERVGIMTVGCPGAEVVAVSSHSGQGMGELMCHLSPGRTFVALGSSGVGKSTLLNYWLGYDAMSTASVRESDHKGRHTTTHRQMFLLPQGSLFIDTPGMREVGLFSFGGVDEAFGDLTAIAASCRFRDCTHDDEPGCAVRAAISDGRLDQERLLSYRKLQGEEQHYEAKQILLRKQISNTRKKRGKTHYKDFVRGASGDAREHY